MPSSARPQDPKASSDGSVILFDRYQVDVHSGELRKEGRKIRLQAQPFQLLVLLLRNAGRVVSREDVRRELWPGDTFVDFDHGLAAAVNKIREALCDSADKPKFVETLTRRGYRFIGKLEPDPPVEIPLHTDEKPAREANVQAGVSKSHVDVDQRYRTEAWVLAVVLTLMGAAIATILFMEKPEPKVQEWNVTQFTSYPGATDAPAFSPDASRIAFGWTSKGTAADLYVKALGGEAMLQLTHHPSEYLSAAWSPDGTQIAFMRIAGPDTGLYVVPTLGGPEQKLLATTAPYDLAAPISWSPDGKWIAYSNQIDGNFGDRMFLFSLDTHKSELFYHDPACMHEGHLAFSNDGKQVAWLCVRRLNAIDLLVGDPEGQSRRLVKTLTAPPYGQTWSADDSKIIIALESGAQSGLYEITLNDGNMKRLSSGVGKSHAHWPAMSAKTGALAWTEYQFRIHLIRADLQNSAKPPQPLLESSRDENKASYSPDGKYIAFQSNRSGDWAVWMEEADGKNLSMISRAGAGGMPKWSPDSRHLAYQQDDGDKQSIYFVDVNERVPRRLVTKAVDVGTPFWSPDGQSLYFQDEGSFLTKYWRCSLGCNNDETLVRDGAKALNMHSTRDAKYWYYTDGDDESEGFKIYRETMHEGQVDTRERVKEIPALVDDSAFCVANDGIYFVSAEKPDTLGYFDFATQKKRDVIKTEKHIGSGFWVSPDGKVALLPQVYDYHQDIMLAEPKR